ncbi:hypothetical protein BU14_0070s0013 [Porphyra umbilicalis]|uniref:Uncharacterized protein n=1 Tax=Porphyra umbilicalis TaxID=2786 RepID=A0A1X6PGC0_PORUM|nr:hypothetical protein BU14_0070s0013 [Porphyra umbilicalis]|eukprot:OSX79838.1 hypothetical protein BU14_0070s0013 [Porphyra umbilicalis]
MGPCTQRVAASHPAVTGAPSAPPCRRAADRADRPDCSTGRRRRATHAEPLLRQRRGHLRCVHWTVGGAARVGPRGLARPPGSWRGRGHAPLPAAWLACVGRTVAGGVGAPRPPPGGVSGVCAATPLFFGAVFREPAPPRRRRPPPLPPTALPAAPAIIIGGRADGPWAPSAPTGPDADHGVCRCLDVPCICPPPPPPPPILPARCHRTTVRPACQPLRSACTRRDAAYCGRRPRARGLATANRPRVFDGDATAQTRFPSSVAAPAESPGGAGAAAWGGGVESPLERRGEWGVGVVGVGAPRLSSGGNFHGTRGGRGRPRG